MPEIDSPAQDEGDTGESHLFLHIRDQEEQRHMLDTLMAELASLVVEKLASPASASSPASTVVVTAGKAQWLVETLLRWTGNAIILDPDATLWHEAIGKKVAFAGQPEATRSRIIRFALTEALPTQAYFSYNPLNEIARHTSEELDNFTEMAKALTNDPSEKGEAAALLLLAVLTRYMEDTTEPSLRGVAQFVEKYPGNQEQLGGIELISYLNNTTNLQLPGHLFSAVLADEFQQLEDDEFVEEMFQQVRSTLSPFTSQRLGDRTQSHDLPLADLFRSQKPTTLYVTCPRRDVELLGPFLHLLCAQFARSLRNVVTDRPLFIAFAGTNILLVSCAERLAADSAAEDVDHLWSAQEFSLNGHPLQMPPAEILAQGRPAILEYLKKLQQATTD